MVSMNQFPNFVHFPMDPHPPVFRPGLHVRVLPLTMTLVVGPLPLVNVPVRVGVFPAAMTDIVKPVPFIFGAIRIQECSLAVFYTVHVTSSISCSVLKSKSGNKNYLIRIKRLNGI